MDELTNAPVGTAAAPVVQAGPPVDAVTPPAIQPAVTAPAVTAPQVDRPAPIATPGLDTRALERARQAELDTAQAQLDVGQAKTGLSEATAATHDANADQVRGQSAELQAEQLYQKEGLDHANKIADSLNDEVKNHKFSDYYGDKTGPEKIKSNILYALGAFAAAGSGNGHNAAAEKIKAINDQNFRKESAELGTKKWAAEQARNGVTDLKAQYKDDIAKLQLKHAMALTASAEEAKATLIKQGIPAEQAEQNVLVMKLRSEGENAYAKGFQQLQHDKATEALERAKLGATYAGIRETARSHDMDYVKDMEAISAKKAAAGADKPLTEGQAKANKFGMQLEEAAKTFEGLPEISDKGKQAIREYNAQQEAAERSPNVNALLTTVGIRKPIEKLLSPEDARVYSAQQRFLTPLLRDESGAAIGASEFSRRYSDLMPMPGDSPETIADKKAMRATVIRGAKEGAGKGASVNKEPAEPSTAKSSIPSAEKIRALPEADRADAIEATAALRDPAKRAKAQAFLSHLGVM